MFWPFKRKKKPEAVDSTSNPYTIRPPKWNNPTAGATMAAATSSSSSSVNPLVAGVVGYALGGGFSQHESHASPAPTPAVDSSTPSPSSDPTPPTSSSDTGAGGGGSWNSGGGGSSDNGGGSFD